MDGTEKNSIYNCGRIALEKSSYPYQGVYCMYSSKKAG